MSQDFTHNKEGWLDYLIRTCRHDQQVLKYASEKLTPALLSSIMGASDSRLIVFSSLRQHWNLYNAVPGDLALQNTIASVFEQFTGHTSEDLASYRQQVQEFLAFLVANPMAPGEDTKTAFAIIRHIYNHGVIVPSFNQSIASASVHQSLDVLHTEIEALKVSQVGQRASSNPFDKKGSAGGAAISTGIAWLDRVLGNQGGLICGSAYGVLAISGGGKSTLAANLTVSLAQQGKKVMLVMTEQSFREARMVDRFWAIVTGKKVDDFRDHMDQDHFPPELVTPSDRAAVEKIGGNIIAHDFAANPGSLDELRTLVATDRPDVLVLDWAGEMAKQLMAVDKGLSDDETRALKYVADEFNKIAIQYGIPTVLFHQIAAHAGRNPMGNFDHTMASNCKQFCYNLAFGCVMTPPDDNGIMSFKVTKGRFGGNSTAIIHFDGARATFKEVKNYRAGRGKWECDGAGVMQVERKSANAAGPFGTASRFSAN